MNIRLDFILADGHGQCILMFGHIIIGKTINNLDLKRLF